jgi:hypothetical protein
MFDRIRNHEILYGIECGHCSEHNANVEFDSSLKIKGELNDSKVLILKPDSFYHSSRMKNDTPPSPDCLILVNCIDKEHYNLYLIELKDVEKLKRLIPEDIVAKFATMVDDFFVKFDDLFKKHYTKIEFYVINPHYKKLRGLELDIVTPSTPLRLYGQAIPIKTRSPLTIAPC